MRDHAVPPVALERGGDYRGERTNAVVGERVRIAVSGQIADDPASGLALVERGADAVPHGTGGAEPVQQQVIRRTATTTLQPDHAQDLRRISRGGRAAHASSA